MIKRNNLIAIGATLASLFFISGQAVASEDDRFAYDTEINSCIAEVGAFANYDDAVRVRHNVVVVKRTRIGYVFTIDTAVFVESGDDAIREYASYCVVRGTQKPVKFDINETSTGA